MPKFFFAAALLVCHAAAQSLGGAGTLRGTVRDPSNSTVSRAEIELSNIVSGFRASTRTDANGVFTFQGVPQNSYRVRVTAAGFEPHTATIAIRTAVPLDLNLVLDLAVHQTGITVEASPAGAADPVPSASATIDRSFLSTLPAAAHDSALNDAIVYTTPGVAADSNGFFHPLGDHAQVSYVLDGQPISDQRNKLFSTSIPANAIQSMEVISGLPAAEYGDKTSLVINATTRSGLGHRRAGSLLIGYGSFGTIHEEATVTGGGPRLGQFLVMNTERSRRFLDSPEFEPVHDTGNSATIFHRTDYQRGARDTFHLNLLAARNWMQIPNTYDQPRQDQRQKVLSYNIAPGYQRTLGPHTLLSVYAFARRDAVDYYPSRNPFDDLPATLGQHRSLANYGWRAEIARIEGRHNLKAGWDGSQTRLAEDFQLGFTDPAYNSGLDFLPSLAPYDLTRGGHLFRFHGKANIHQLAWFGQDSITLGDVVLQLGVRFDRYRGLSDRSAVQPRTGIAYLFRPTRTVIRAGYSHTMETPTTENLLASSSTGAGGLAGSLFQGAAEQRPIVPGSRNQYDAGLQQSLGKWAMLDVSYFRKYTRNAFDFDTLFSTPVTFPIGWAHSKLDGVSARITTIPIHGLRAYITMGHANARFFGPENGGIVFNDILSPGAYRQDHDQVYQQNVHLYYEFRRWHAGFTWRYDSGLVIGAVSSLGDARALTAAQMAAIGFNGKTAERIRIPAAGTFDPDHNPARTTPRHVFHTVLGTDNLFHTEHVRTALRITVSNLTNTAALYNFLSPFSGTHWVPPRSLQVQAGWTF